MNTQSTGYAAQPENTFRTRRDRRFGGWVGGLMLIALGSIFLVQNLTGYTLHNWWALFILMPAFGMLSGAYKTYQDAGRVNSTTRGLLMGAFFMSCFAAVFFLDLSLTILGPLFLLAIGAALIINSLLPN